MVQKETNLVVADNTGARSVRVFHIVGGSHHKTGTVGDVVVVAIKDALPFGKAHKGDVCKAVIVRIRKPYQRSDGSTVRFDDNACVLINSDGTPRGTRIFGPVARELRDGGYMKIISLAEEVL